MRTLQGALLSGRVGHAYLFCGPRGTGKTTMARLLAKSLNCHKPKETGDKTKEPCNTCSSCSEINEGRSLDIIEIDAASNRGIDEIRNLKDSARVAATSGNYKVFIIDEVHMLTPPAFNALLKILEEPPAHVVFVMATTEAHKLPETVLSRVQRFDFKKIDLDDIKKKLTAIIAKEKIQVSDLVLSMIANSSSGSLRDAESSLTKLISYAGSKITDEQAAELLGVVPQHIHRNLLELINKKNAKDAIAQLTSLYESGVDLENFTKQFTKYMRSELLTLVSQPVVSLAPGQASPEFLIKSINTFLKAQNDLKFSAIPQLPLELAVLELAK